MSRGFDYSLCFEKFNVTPGAIKSCRLQNPFCSDKGDGRLIVMDKGHQALRPGRSVFNLKNKTDLDMDTNIDR